MKVELWLADHPKTRALAKIWGCHPYMVAGFLLELWAYCQEYQDDGNVDGRPADVLDELAAPCVASTIGTLPTVRAALIKVGFVDEDGHIHDWQIYAGALVDKRRKDRKRKRLARGKGRTKTARKSKGRPADTPRTSAPRVEKSRGEKSRVTPQQQQPPAASARVLDYTTRCCLAVNRVLSEQLAGAYNSFVPNIERPIAKTWESAGIPIELAEEVITELAARFPNGRGRQPLSLGYFTAALHEMHAKRQASGGGAAPLSTSDRAKATLERMQREAEASAT